MNTTAVVMASPNAVAHAATAQEIKGQVQRIQQVMKAVMKDKVHYGVVPGTPKPSLWKPGAEVLQATFRIAVSYRVEDLSDHDCVRYRVVAVGTHQSTGIIMGEGMGEASSNEEKYKWKKAYKREFENTDEDRRRIKYGWDKESRSEYEINQVRTEPADVANTILKMACKRAQVAMVLNVTAASDIFTQDLEDMPEDLRDAGGSDYGHDQAPRGRPKTRAPQARQPSAQNGNGQGTPGRATEKQIKLVGVKLDQSGIPENDFLAKFELGAISELPFDRVNDALAWIANPGDRAEGDQGDDQQAGDRW